VAFDKHWILLNIYKEHTMHIGIEQRWDRVFDMVFSAPIAWGAKLRAIITST
jgi:hypothetical protein